MDKVVEFFRDVLGAKVGPMKPWMEKFGHRCRDVWIGEEEPFGIEVSESVNDELPTGKIHKLSAPSFQFLALEVRDLPKALAEVRAKGVRISDIMKLEDPRFGEFYETMVHPKAAYGLIIELLEVKGRRPQPGE
ncbi:MAG: hypothetical protein HY670_08760 [Chloroflexi bacterium]|nr:hypothetical protein [Chloroflexota bacterium]